MKLPAFILAIDSYLIRKGMAALLNRIPGIRIAGEVGSGPELVSYLRHHHPDFLIISESLFNGNTGFFITNPEWLNHTILLKKESSDAEKPGIRSSIHIFESRETITVKVRELIKDYTGDPDPGMITPREKEIVRLISMGYTNKQIAEKLFISTHTVTTHRKNITGKLGIKSVSGLTVYAIVNNIVTIDEVASNPEQ
ncbi:MAG: DNA-binding response regulator [Bacteroidetes bacterium]|nr:MAG: DNA-binding response regulator [Bacteroidota bacterium]